MRPLLWCALLAFAFGSGCAGARTTPDEVTAPEPAVADALEPVAPGEVGPATAEATEPGGEQPPQGTAPAGAAPQSESTASGAADSGLDPKVEAEIKRLRDEIDTLTHESLDDPYEEVVRRLHRIQQLDPHDIDAYLDEAWLHYSRGKGTPREAELDRKAIATYQRGMTNNPDDPEIPWNYGFLFHYKHRNNFDAGAVWLEKACRLATDSQYPRVLGSIYEQLGRRDDACRLYQRALGLTPDDELARRKYDTLGCGDAG